MLAIEIGDQLYYTAEFRRQSGLDAALPDAGVVVSKANDRVKQGEGPVIFQESAVTAGELSEAPFLSTGVRNTFDDRGSVTLCAWLTTSLGSEPQQLLAFVALTHLWGMPQLGSDKRSIGAIGNQRRLCPIAAHLIGELPDTCPG